MRADPSCRSSGVGVPSPSPRTVTPQPSVNSADGSGGLDLPRLLNCKQAGDYTGLGERYMRRLIDEERISFVRIGGIVRFERSILDDFIAAHRVPVRRVV